MEVIDGGDCLSSLPERLRVTGIPTRDRGAIAINPDQQVTTFKKTEEQCRRLGQHFTAMSM